MARERSSVVLSPLQLREYYQVDPALPALIVEKIDRDQQREFQYATRALTIGGLITCLAIGGFVYLVMHDKDTPAYTLLGSGVLGLIGSFLRARLRLGK
jgi:hypothetical protein